jgi:hypothetical protein
MMSLTFAHAVLLISIITFISAGQCLAEDAHPDETNHKIEITNIYSGCTCKGEDWIIVISNFENATQDFSNWTLQVDLVNVTYAFPQEFGLPSNFKVRVHTKSGADTSTDLYWDCEAWDGGAVAKLIDDKGKVVSRYS